MSFRSELEELINKHCKENGSNTPDFILADYLALCLKGFDKATRRREEWYGRPFEEARIPHSKDEGEQDSEPL